MEKIIEWTRQNIPAWTKEKWKWLELIIEKAPKILYEQTEKKETNKKRGRPKKEKSPDKYQTKIDTFIDLEN